MKTHTVEAKPAVQVDAAKLVSLREKLHLSRVVFARYLPPDLRTLENWEQGWAKPKPHC